MRTLREIYYSYSSVTFLFDIAMLEKVSWIKRISRKERKDAKILKNIKSIKKIDPYVLNGVGGFVRLSCVASDYSLLPI